MIYTHPTEAWNKVKNNAITKPYKLGLYVKRGSAGIKVLGAIDFLNKYANAKVVIIPEKMFDAIRG